MAETIAGAPDSRQLQANERTMLAWVRTSVSLISFGFAIARLGEWVEKAGRRDPFSATVLLGATFAFLGAAAQIIGVARYLIIRRALLEGRTAPIGGTAITALAIAVTAVGLLVGFYVFV